MGLDDNMEFLVDAVHLVLEQSARIEGFRGRLDTRSNAGVVRLAGDAAGQY